MYTYVATAQPTVTSISPTHGDTAGGTLVTITGTAFTGVTAVKFGGTLATGFTFVDDTHITATSPAHIAGAHNVFVVTPGGTSATNAGDLFTYTVTPTVTSVSPTTGSDAGGPIVTITGTGLTGASAVSFGGTAATAFTVVSDTTVTATSPAGGVGSVDITVTTLGGTTATGAGDMYAYVAIAQPDRDKRQPDDRFHSGRHAGHDHRHHPDWHDRSQLWRHAGDGGRGSLSDVSHRSEPLSRSGRGSRHGHYIGRHLGDRRR